jgi:acyl-coenzyme A thioesterase PaaI-like protein
MELISPEEPVQDIAWPEGTCYGCGPANTDGLQLKSFLAEDENSLVASFDGDGRFNSGMPNVAYGGLIASLIDCHSMWTAITFAHLEEGQSFSDGLMLYVTAELNIEYKEPTPLDQPIHLQSSVVDDVGRRTRVTCETRVNDTITAVGDVLAVRTSGH